MNVTQILEQEKCCGCTACLSICPLKCISMVEDEQGFLRPQVDNQKCIDCGQCEKVCPALHLFEERMPIKVWAAKNNDEAVRMSSSSGGIFMALADWTIQRGGVVFGARFDENWEVMHDYAETPEAVEAFKGSKYLQSRMGDCYVRAKEFLNAGRWVLFTGVQCQIAGLKKYLGKDYEKLIAVDVICHGVPSPLVWRNYVHHIHQQLTNGKGTIESISFRDKSRGWKRFGLAFRFKQPIESKGKPDSLSIHCETISTHNNLFKDLYLRGFLALIYLRPSCYCCPSKRGRSQSDITIGDYWGLPKELLDWDDDIGISLILVLSSKGANILEELNVSKRLSTYKKGVKRNPNFAASSKKPKASELFWELYPQKGIAAIEAAVKKTEPSTVYRFLLKFYWLFKKVFKI